LARHSQWYKIANIALDKMNPSTSETKRKKDKFNDEICESGVAYRRVVRAAKRIGLGASERGHTAARSYDAF